MQNHKEEYVRRISPELSNLLEYIEDSDHKFICEEKDTCRQYTYINKTGVRFSIPTDIEQNVFYNHIRACVDKKIRFGITENQMHPDGCGLFLDFDIYQMTSTRIYAGQILLTLLRKIAAVINNVIDLTPIDKNTGLYFIVTARKSTKQLPSAEIKKIPECDGHDEVYRDGIHIRVPTIKLSRDVKIVLVNEIVKEVTKFNSSYQQIILPNALDRGSAYVPVFLYGTSRPGKDCYIPLGVYRIVIESVHSIIPYDCSEFSSTNTEVNVCHEMSLLSERKDGIIKKYFCVNTSKYDIAVKRWNKHSIKNIVERSAEGKFSNDEAYLLEMKQLVACDGDAKYITALLDMLGPKRYTMHMYWIKVMWILANKSPAYRCLAEYFSRKAPEKFDSGEFEKQWIAAVDNAFRFKQIMLENENYQRRSYGAPPVLNETEISSSDEQSRYRIQTLIRWANEDSRQKMRQLEAKSVATRIQDIIFKPIRNGRITNADIATILKEIYGSIYAIDFVKDIRGNPKPIMMEFVIPSLHTCRRPEAYKWRFTDKNNGFLTTVISDNLSQYCEVVLMELKKSAETIEDSEDMDDAQAEGRKKWLNQVAKTFAVSANSLGCQSFINGCMQNFTARITRPGLLRQMDKNPYHLGVGNGLVVMKAEGTHEYISDYHNFLVHKHTETEYVEYDPRDPHQRELLQIMRELFTDGKSDTHEYFMCMLASGVDGTIKDTVWNALFGLGANGKSTASTLTYLTLGEAYVASIPTSSVTCSTRDGGNATPDYAMIIGRRMVFLNENEAGKKLNMATIKSLTGSDITAIRRMYQDMENVILSAVYVQSGNHDLEINDTTYGAWRRMKKISMEICFRMPGESMDPSNPYHKRADPKILKRLTTDVKYRSAWLAILLEYRRRFYTMYGGSLLKVPHPHIIVDTEKLRQSLDTFNLFIVERCVAGVSAKRKAECQDLDDVMNIYVSWSRSRFDANKPEAQIRRGLAKALQDSSIGKQIQRDSKGKLVCKGIRFLTAEQVPTDGEIYLSAQKDISVSETPKDRQDLANRIEKRIREETSDGDISDTSDSKRSIHSIRSVSSEEEKDREEEKKKKKHKVKNKAKGVVSGEQDLGNARKYLTTLDKALEDIKNIRSETVSEYVDRMIREFDEYKQTGEIIRTSQPIPEEVIFDDNMAQHNIEQKRSQEVDLIHSERKVSYEQRVEKKKLMKELMVNGDLSVPGNLPEDQLKEDIKYTQKIYKLSYKCIDEMFDSDEEDTDFVIVDEPEEVASEDIIDSDIEE
jgi:hypothetical protein